MTDKKNAEGNFGRLFFKAIINSGLIDALVRMTNWIKSELVTILVGGVVSTNVGPI